MICCTELRKKKTVVVFTCLCICVRSGLAIGICCRQCMRPSRRCLVTFSTFWPSGNDSLNDKSESWCFCRVIIIIYFFFFLFTGLMSMWLTLHHTEIRSRQSCSVFWICTTLFPVVWSVVSSASLWQAAAEFHWWYMQRNINWDRCRRVQVPRLTLVVHHTDLPVP